MLTTSAEIEICSLHMQYARDLYEMTNNTINRVVGKGTVRFCMADEMSLTLIEVRHIPSLQKKLIFIGTLDTKGCNFAASGEILRVSKENTKMLRGRKTGGLYRLEGSVQRESC